MTPGVFCPFLDTSGRRYDGTMAAKIGRNDPCHCGSGKKYKHCHADREESGSPLRRFLLIAVLVLFGGTLIMAIASAVNQPDTLDGRVWSAEHGHYH